jgi:hypothetical protein
MPDFTAFCDESGQRDYGPATDKFFVVASCLVPSDEASHLEDELRGLKRTYWGKPDVELKSNWLRIPEQRTKHYTTPHGIGLPEINSFMEALYTWLPKTPLALLAGVVDKPMMQAKYAANAHYAGGVAYTMFLQRFQKFLGRRSATGSVIFDDPAGKSPGGHEWRTLLQRQHSKLKTYGCPYTRTQFPSIGPLSFVDSKTSPFVQVADIVSYNTFRQFRMHGKDWEDPLLKSLPLYDHFARIAPSFDRGPDGEFAGFGVAKWPLTHRMPWKYTAG